ncbi:hypothetical protein BGZ51_004532, partial [Haplosporangium sp. Z 767]
MSRSSPLATPIMDEDFDLCISETNLPFPYSDHCSTGPPSLYEFDDGDDDEEEEEEEGDEEDDQEHGEEVDDDDQGQITIRRGVLLDADSDEDPSLTLTHLNMDNGPVSPKPNTHSSRGSKKQLHDLQDQLHSRLERIHEEGRRRETAIPGVPSLLFSGPTTKARPHYTRQSFSFDSYDAWEEEEDEQETHQEKGLLPTVTSTVTSVTYAVGKYWSKKIYESLLRSRDPQAYYTHLLQAATNYEQWAEAAVILDRLQGKDKWKNEASSPHYDYELLGERLKQLVSARKSGDLGQMIFLLRTSLSRNLGNVGRRQLYANTIIGTKRLIENYNEEVIRQLNIICDTESDDFSVAAKLEFFTHTRQAFGRTALLLSGGATMGLMHIGVIKTLFESHLLPRIISGSSCGSIIAAILCTRTDEEIPSMFQFEKFNFTVFHTVEEKGDVLARLVHFLKNGALFDSQVLKTALRENIGNVTFQEAYNRTRRILNITVSTSAAFDMPRLLNYLTAPNVLIWSAVATSCAAPFIYNSSPLMAKDKNGEEVHWNPSRYHWIDGSVDNDLPMNKLSELFNVNHFIVCQVNPYIVPFLQTSLARSPTNRILGWMLYQARSEMQHRLNQLSLLGIMPGLMHKVQAIMSQRYYGDITIVPSFGVDDYLNIVSNPTNEFLMNATLKGERATWPLSSIVLMISFIACVCVVLKRIASIHSNRVRLCFGAIGRSNSSPVSPTRLQGLGMSQFTAPMNFSTANTGNGLSETEMSDDIQSHNVSEILPPILTETPPTDTVEKDSNSAENGNDLPTDSQLLSPPVSIAFASTVRNKSKTRRSTHTIPPSPSPLKRANSSSGPTSSSSFSSITSTRDISEGGSVRVSQSTISSTSTRTFDHKHSNSIGSASDLQHGGDTTMNITSRRSSSSSMSSSRSILSSEKDTYFTSFPPGGTLGMPRDLLGTSSSVANASIAAVVHTTKTSNSGRKKSNGGSHSSSSSSPTLSSSPRGS